MDNILADWTIERVTSLAVNEGIAESGRRLADPTDSKWQELGFGDFSIWGEYQSSADKPYQTKIDLLSVKRGSNHWDCTCTTRQKPCKHILALLYMFIGQPDALPQAPVPDFVSEWFDSAARRALQKQERKRQNQDSSNPQRDADRQRQYDMRKKRIADGLEELEQWLINLIRRGLADPQVQTYDFWDSRAARLVDAQANGIATWISEMGSIPVSGTEWIEPLLDQLGRLYLLIESFKRFDDLSIDTQGDIRAVIGWHMKPHEFDGDDIFEDNWLVIGRYTDRHENKMSSRRVWLRGLETGHDALIQEFVFGTPTFTTDKLMPGKTIRGTMTFYPSRYPLRAELDETFVEVDNEPNVQGTSIQKNVEAYSLALSQNPWLPQFPFLLDKVITTHYDKNWVLREDDGTYLPISHRFKEKYWSLMALSGGHPIQVAGEWDGTSFYPTGAVADGRFVDFEEIGKI